MNPSLETAKTHLSQLGHWCEHFKEYLDQYEHELDQQKGYELFKNIEAIGVVLVDTMNKFPQYPQLDAIMYDIKKYKAAIPEYITPNTSQNTSQIAEISSQLASLPSPSSQV